jgi:hypothetical protein
VHQSLLRLRSAAPGVQARATPRGQGAGPSRWFDLLYMFYGFDEVEGSDLLQELEFVRDLVQNFSLVLGF